MPIPSKHKVTISHRESSAYGFGKTEWTCIVPLETAMELAFAHAVSNQKIAEKVWNDETTQRIMLRALDPDGQLHGLCEEYSEDGKLRKSGSYVHGKSDGEHLHYGGRDGTTLLERIPYKLGNIDGILETYNTEGQLGITCNYVEGKKHGIETCYFHTGEVQQVASYAEGQLEGDTIEYDSMGNVCKRAEYQAGKLHGLCEVYCNRTGGLKSRANYAEGEFDGSMEMFHPNGNLSYQATYKQGKLDGQEARFHPNGQIEQRCHYVEGVMSGLDEHFDETGALLTRATMENGMRSGPYEEFYPSGQVKRQTSYIVGMPSNMHTDYYESGNLKERVFDYEVEGHVCQYESYHENGLLHEKGTLNHRLKRCGEWEQYNQDAELVAKGAYANGLRIGMWHCVEEQVPYAWYLHDKCLGSDENPERLMQNILATRTDKLPVGIQIQSWDQEYYMTIG